jgi:hypothetical protein
MGKSGIASTIRLSDLVKGPIAPFTTVTHSSYDGYDALFQFKIERTLRNVLTGQTKKDVSFIKTLEMALRILLEAPEIHLVGRQQKHRHIRIPHGMPFHCWLKHNSNNKKKKNASGATLVHKRKREI